MDILVLGGDRRFTILTKMLVARGLHARWVGDAEEGVPLAPLEAVGRAETIVLNSPLKLAGVSWENVLKESQPGTQFVFCGPQPMPAGAEGIDLSQDETFLRRNARLTAEGAIFSAAGVLESALMDCRVLVIGWGRIGRALAEKLLALGAKVTVASRSERNRRAAMLLGAQAVDTSELSGALPGHQVVFSTPAVPVLGRGELSRLDPECLVIDLASAPYGVDLEAAREKNIRAWREPGLPGRYCPESAARVLLSHILDLRKGGVRHD